MTINKYLFRSLFATLVALALTACGAPNTGDTSTEDDAGNPNSDVAVTDRPVPQPDRPLIADAGNPKTVVDAGMPVDDAPVVEDTSPKSPQMAQICARLNNFGWHTQGASTDGFMHCVVNEITLGSDLQDQLVARYDTGACDSTTLECVLPTGGAADGCTFSNLTPDMTSFQSVCHGITRLMQIGRRRFGNQQ